MVDQRHARVDCSPDPLQLEAGGQLVHLVAVVGAGTDHLGGGAIEAQYDNIVFQIQLDNLSTFGEKFCLKVIYLVDQPQNESFQITETLILLHFQVR